MDNSRDICDSLGEAAKCRDYSPRGYTDKAVYKVINKFNFIYKKLVDNGCAFDYNSTCSCAVVAEQADAYV